MNTKKVRLKCLFWGCATSEDVPECRRCGVYIYDDFIEHGKLEWLNRVRWRLVGFFRLFMRKTCDECGRKFWFGYATNLCSEACHDEWLPF